MLTGAKDYCRIAVVYASVVPSLLISNSYLLHVCPYACHCNVPNSVKEVLLADLTLAFHSLQAKNDTKQTGVFVRARQV